MSKKKRVLIAAMSLTIGGAEKSLVNLLNLLDYEKIDVDLLLFQRWGDLIGQIPEEVNQISIPEIDVLYGGKPARRLPLCKKVALRALRCVATAAMLVAEKEFDRQRIWRWMHFYSKVAPKLNGRYDCAVSFSGGETFWYIVEQVDAARKVTFFHSDFANIDIDVESHCRYLQSADCIATISEACAESLRGLFPSQAKKVHVVSNPSCVKLIRSLSKERVNDGFFGIEDVLRVVSVGRLDTPKGFDIAAKAASIAKASCGPRFEWIVVGDGPERAKIEKIIEREGIGDVFRLIGKKLNPYPYLGDADVFVQPSRYEGKSVALDEARVFGLPVLATDYSSVNDQVNAGVDGLVVPMSPEGVAEGLMRLVEQPELLECLARNASAFDVTGLEDISSFMSQL